MFLVSKHKSSSFSFLILLKILTHCAGRLWGVLLSIVIFLTHESFADHTHGSRTSATTNAMTMTVDNITTWHKARCTKQPMCAIM